MRAIDLDDRRVVHFLGNLDSRWKPHCFLGEDAEALSSVVEAFEKLAVDAVPVVRCKDCKWYESDKRGQYFCANPYEGMASNVPLKEKDYCCYGKRKGDD